MHDYTNLGRAMRAERNAANLTQDALAKALKISRPALNQIENRARRPDADTLPRLCHNWPTVAAGIRIAIEHLRDEWDRCHLPAGAVKIRATDDQDTEDAAANLRAIRAIDNALYITLCHLMRDVIRAASPEASGHDEHTHVKAIAAETRAIYGTTKRHK